MSEPRQPTENPSPPRSEKKAGVHTRFDPPHELPFRKFQAAVPPREPVAGEVAAAAGQDPQQAVAQIQLQAEQLAEHLQTRQRELDRHEAQLNAQQLALEQESRIFRLRATETEAGLSERELDLLRREADVEQRAAAVSQAEAAQALVRQQTAELQAMRQALGRARQDTANRLWQLRGRLQRQRAEQQARAARLALAESALAQQVAELGAKRQRFAAELDGLRHTLRQREQQFGQQQLQAETEIRETQARLKQRSDVLEQRAVALEQLRREVARVHAESLEQRFLAEQTWAKLAPQADAAEVTASLSALRRQLQEHSRETRQSLEHKETQLRSLAGQIHERQASLTVQHQALQEWVRRRREQIEAQSASLAERQRELERQQQQGWELQQLWCQERLELLRQMLGSQTATPQHGAQAADHQPLLVQGEPGEDR